MYLKQFRFLVLPGLIFLFGMGCSTAPEKTPEVVETQVSIPWTPVAVVDGTDVVFTLNPELLLEGRDTPESVSLVGTFTSWADSSEFPLTFNTETGHWTGRFSLARVDVPGNSGMPEFQFTLDGDQRISGNLAPRGYCWGSNFVVLIPPETPESLGEKDLMNRGSQPPAEGRDPGELANFRGLGSGNLGPGALFRSYHPFTPSKGGSAEEVRLNAAQALMEKAGIKAVINLTDPPGILGSPRVPEYYKELGRNGDALFVVTDYNTVYYHPEGPEFRQQIKTILDFIADTPGPYLVHCRLGTDRTGVVSAVLQSLLGASWEEIAGDYELSNRMMIKEYRSVRLLAYSLGRMLGQKPAEVGNLKGSMTKFVMESGVSQETLKKVLQNLSASY